MRQSYDDVGPERTVHDDDVANKRRVAGQKEENLSKIPS
jgi:hypothetical protein